MNNGYGRMPTRGNPLRIPEIVEVALPLPTGTNTIGAVTGNVASGATDSGNPIKTGGKYNTTAPTLDNGDRGDTQLDVAANTLTSLGTTLFGEDTTNTLIAILPKVLASATYAPTVSAIFGTDVDLSVKASAGNLFSITCSNINAAVRYLQIHNKASAPANPNVPIISLPIPAGSATSPGYLSLTREDFGQGGIYLSTGIAIGISTTEATFTAATTTDHDYFVTWI